MAEVSRDAVVVLQYLLPGFLAAWIFYGLTSHTKPPQFERVVQALILTFLIHALLPIARWGLELVGAAIPIRPWDTIAEGFTLLVLAVLTGVVLAYCTNKDSVHKWLRQRGFTTRTSHPSEWVGVFSNKVTFVVLHMTDERRLYGWPKEWPIEPDKGHFFMMEPSWIKEDGSLLDVTGVEGLLVSAKDVKWVEFVHSRSMEQLR